MPKLRNILIFVIIAIIIVLLYVVFFNNKEDQASLIPSASPSLPITNDADAGSLNADVSSQANDELSQGFLSLLLGVQGITLNDSIFKTGSAFYSLVDPNIVLVPDGTEGRANPFAPIGSDPSLLPPTSSSTTNSSTATNSTPEAGTSVKPN